MKLQEKRARIDHRPIFGGIAAITIATVVFLLPFVFVVLTASKTASEASQLAFSWPEEWVFWDNVVDVLTMRNGLIVRAFANSIILTVIAVSTMTIFATMIGYIAQRRGGIVARIVNWFVMVGLIVPAAIVPTIWVLQHLGLFKTITGLALVEATYGLAFCVMLFRAFVSTIPRELDEAAILDGSGPLRLFFQVVLPLLKPVVVTVIVVQSVGVFNSFTGPLYFLPGDQNATVQLTLFNFQSQSLNQFNLLFTDILLITIPPLILYVFFNRQIVAGMTGGAIKG